MSGFRWVVLLLVAGCATGPNDDETATIVDLQAGSASTCALTSARQLWCWGQQVGTVGGDGVHAVPVRAAPSLSVDEFALAKGAPSLCAVSRSATYCWGWWYAIDSPHPYGPAPTVPALIQDTVAVHSLDTYLGHTCAVTESGSAFCWGGSVLGRRGEGTPHTSLGSLVPNTVAGTLSIASVTTGRVHTCALLSDGGVACWGAGELLGAPDAELFTTPEACFYEDRSCAWAPVRLSLTGVTRLAAASEQTCAIAGGAVYCWGYGLPGAEGMTPAPTLVAVPKPASEIALGGAHACVLDPDGAAWCWGMAGPWLGHPAIDGLPHQVETPLRFVRLSTGGEHTCALTEAGEVYCWGKGSQGELGDGRRADSMQPVQVDLTAALAP